MKKLMFWFIVLTLVLLCLFPGLAFGQLFSVPAARLGKGTVEQIAYSPDGKMLAVAGSLGFWLYDASSLAEVGLLEEHTAPVESIAFSPNGTFLASVDADNNMRLWDVKTRQQIGMLQKDTGKVFSVTFSPDGKLLASGNEDGNIYLWNVQTQQQIGVLQGDEEEAFDHPFPVSALAFSPDGKLLASGGLGFESIVRLWDVQSQKQVRLLQMDRVESVAFSPDGKWLASGSQDGVILLWELGTSSPWNVNSDGIVDVFDLVQVASHFGQSGLELNGDVNRDGEIDVLDLVLVGSHFGEQVISAAPPMKVSSHLEPSQRLNQL